MAAAVVGLAPAAALGIAAAPAQAAPAQDCAIPAGTSYTGLPWQQSRLDFVQAWQVTKGKGIKVAVIDSGLGAHDNSHLVIDAVDATSVMSTPDGHGTADCLGHGTEVSAIIAASRTDSRFVGVAPEAQIIPVKQSHGQNDGSQAAVSRGIRYAVAAGAQVINISLAFDAPRSALGQLEQAVAYADSKGVVIVAAAGNDGGTSNEPGFPAAFSPYYRNVIAVSATTQSDAVSPFSERGSYVTVAAPGSQVIVPNAVSGYTSVSGTSFAAPYVSGTVALMLAADPALRGHPDQVRERIIATADAPPVAVPSRTYGYGIVNPYLAVTTMGDSAPLPVSTARARQVAQPLAPHHADHRLAHIALGVGAGLVGLAALVAVGAAVVRAGRRRPPARTG